jgi:HD superfamily phosphohydrolase
MMEFNKENIENSIKTELNDFKKLLGYSSKCKFEDIIVKILSEVFIQPPFETLNKRYQLGLLNKVEAKWVNVKHTRLDHSIGVATKCLVVCSILNTNSKSINIVFDDVLELCIAASLHDIAHLPYSHAFERGILSLARFNIGVTHEDRVAPLLVQENSYFDGIRSIILSNTNRENKEDSILRIICLISPEMGEKHTKDIKNFKWPSKAIAQLLSSEIDLDRVDYILRDTKAVDYKPVVKIHKEITDYLNHLELKEINLIDKGKTFGEYELCIPEDSLYSIFNLLVSRVLLYKNIYFSRKVRAFEANLTDLVGKLVDNRIPLDLLQLSTMGDDEFKDEKLNSYLSKINLRIIKEKEKDSIEAYVDAIQKEKINMFAYVVSIKESQFKKHPRIKQEFLNNINSRKYIQDLKRAIVDFLNEHSEGDTEYKEPEFLFDIFNLKTGGGDLLVVETDKKGNLVYKTLKDFMNGSNMARLCKESRIDIYLNSHYHGSGNITNIRNLINQFFDQYN